MTVLKLASRNGRYAASAWTNHPLPGIVDNSVSSRTTNALGQASNPKLPPREPRSSTRAFLGRLRRISYMLVTYGECSPKKNIDYDWHKRCLLHAHVPAHRLNQLRRVLADTVLADRWDLLVVLNLSRWTPVQ